MYLQFILHIQCIVSIQYILYTGKRACSTRISTQCADFVSDEGCKCVAATPLVQSEMILVLRACFGLPGVKYASGS